MGSDQELNIWTEIWKGILMTGGRRLALGLKSVPNNGGSDMSELEKEMLSKSSDGLQTVRGNTVKSGFGDEKKGLNLIKSLCWMDGNVLGG